jgi:long-chain acyl-CoA synthetase
MDPWIHEFLQVAIGVSVRVCSGASGLGSGTVMTPCNIHSAKPGTVGGPIPNCELRLETFEDSPDPECGEVCAGGQTRQLFFDDEHKWARTGDIGKWDNDGYLMIVDRIRSVFKLSQGEYVAASCPQDHRTTLRGVKGELISFSPLNPQITLFER